VILLVRHGATETTGRVLPGRAPGLHLSEAGVRQARELAAHIARLTAVGEAAGDEPRVPGDAGEKAVAHAGGRADPREARAGTDDPRMTAGVGEARAVGDDPRVPGDAGEVGEVSNARDGGDATETPVGARRPAMPRRPVAAVYASPLERTCETAEPIARAVGCQVQIDDGLLELDIGDWTGMEIKRASERREWATIQRYPSGFRFPGGESFLDMQMRMVTTLDRLRSRHPGETVVAVSHADPIRSVVAHALGTHLDLFQRLVVSPCSLTAVALGDHGPIVLTVNAIPGSPS
jgi:probable phosphoglycerate mutase